MYDMIEFQTANTYVGLLWFECECECDIQMFAIDKVGINLQIGQGTAAKQSNRKNRNLILIFRNSLSISSIF